MFANTLAKRKLLVCVLLVALITLVYLPYMARQSSHMYRRLSQGDAQEEGKVRLIRSPYLPFRRRLQSPIHSRKSGGHHRHHQHHHNITADNNHHRAKVHTMYRDTLDKFLREAKTFRVYFHRSYNVFPWPMRRMESSRKKHRYLIYRCDGLIQCGGWVNRVKGIVTSYLLASLTNRTLKVEMLDSSCPFTNYLTPNVVNWTLSVSIHKKLPRQDKNVFIMKAASSGGNSPFAKQGGKLNVSQLFPSKVKYVYFNASRFMADKIRDYVTFNHMLEWMRDLNKTEINSALLRFLFKPSPSLARQIKQFGHSSSLSHHRDKLACASNPSHSDLLHHPHHHHHHHHLHDDATSSTASLTTFINSYSRNASYKIFVTPDSLREALVQSAIMASTKSKPSKENFVAKPANLLRELLPLASNVNANVTTRTARATAQRDDMHMHNTATITGSSSSSSSSSCNDVEDIFAYMVFMHCDVILVNDAPSVHLAALARGVGQGAVCVPKDVQNPSSKKSCL